MVAPQEQTNYGSGLLRVPFTLAFYVREGSTYEEQADVAGTSLWDADNRL